MGKGAVHTRELRHTKNNAPCPRVRVRVGTAHALKRVAPLPTLRGRSEDDPALPGYSGFLSSRQMPSASCAGRSEIANSTDSFAG